MVAKPGSRPTLPSTGARTTVYVSDIHHRPLLQTARQYLQLTKPRVVLLAVFCAMIGMFLATDAMVPWQVLICGTAGITLLAASGFVLNCLIERHIDAQMRRTAHRSSARGQVSISAALGFATVLGGRRCSAGRRSPTTCRRRRSSCS